jgi:hypothetical protein
MNLSRISGVGDILKNRKIAHLFIHHHKVVGSNLVSGLNVDVDESSDKVKINIIVEKGKFIKKPVHMCFGMIPKSGVQKLVMDVNIGSNSNVGIIAHCAFPNAIDVKHIMDAKIQIGKNAAYSYFERHIHGKEGGIEVYPTAKINLLDGAKFRSEFELLRGRAGHIEIDYEANCDKRSILEMISRINAKGNDSVKIKETAHSSFNSWSNWLYCCISIFPSFDSNYARGKHLHLDFCNYCNSFC